MMYNEQDQLTLCSLVDAVGPGSMFGGTWVGHGTCPGDSAPGKSQSLDVTPCETLPPTSTKQAKEMVRSKSKYPWPSTQTGAQIEFILL